MAKKIKKTIDEQINFMRDEKNISFNIYNEKDAKNFLENSTYFYKLKSFAKLFEKDINSDKYCNLGFEHLVELSKLDLYLRRILFKMCLSIEHQLKLNLLNDIAADPDEDGYCLVQCYFEKNNYFFKKIENDINRKKEIKNKTTTYASEINEKYFPEIPIWAFVETLSFNNFIAIYSLYYRMKEKRTGKKEDKMINSFFWSIRIIRNACAHNNCIINSLKKRLPVRNGEIIYELTQRKGIKFSKKEKQKFDFALITDISIVIVCFNTVMKSSNIVSYSMEELKEIFDNRFIKNKDYFNEDFIDHKFIIDSFKLIKKIIDIY